MQSYDTINSTTKGFHWELLDKHYLILWDKRDLPAIFRLSKLIRESDRSKREELLDIFGNSIDRKLNDHHIPITELVPESLDMAFTEDILTFKGITRFCQLICLKSNQTGHTVAVGTGTTQAQAFDSQLVSEVTSVEISTNGFFDPSGIRIWYGGTFGESVPTNTFKESCIRDRASVINAVVFARNTFTTNYIDHNQGTSGFTAAGVFEFIPIV